MDHKSINLIIDSVENLPLRRSINELLGLIFLGRKSEYSVIIDRMWSEGLTAEIRAGLRDALNPFLRYQQREFTSHGIHRSFRFWSESEKRLYLRAAMEIVDCIRSITSKICFGYGTSLAIARSSDLIPHDDDVDLLVVFEKSDFPTFRLAAERVVELLKAVKDWEVVQPEDMINLIQVKKGDFKVDIFICLDEEGVIASFPGPRHLILTEDLFPLETKALFGVEVPVPGKINNYLSKVYGENWLMPDPLFSHSWDAITYSDLFR